MEFPMICKSVEGTPAQLNLASYHLTQRTVFFSGQVDSASADLIVQELLYLYGKSREPIVMYINSPGGEVASGLGIWDTMQHIKKQCPLITCCNGLAASFAALLLAAGSKRYIVPNGEVKNYTVHPIRRFPATLWQNCRADNNRSETGRIP